MPLWKKKPRHLRTGSRGESLAVWYLRMKGYRIIHRNFLCRVGEIDIIATKGSLLIFAEVRTRTTGGLQHPLATVDPIKVARTVRAAMSYLKFHPRTLSFCRFDIVAVDAGRRFPIRGIQHVRGAFDTTSGEYDEGRKRDALRKRRAFVRKKGGPGR